MEDSSQYLAHHKVFYDGHQEFTHRTLAEYYISPGTKAKFDRIMSYLKKLEFKKALDVGCSGNSLLHFLDQIQRKFFLDLAQKPLKNYLNRRNYVPIMGSLVELPFHTHTFDLITALDVLEHIKSDGIAAREISRVLKPQGILVITVPHRMKYYTYQDQLIGHYRRYELEELDKLFPSSEFKKLTVFGVYGQAMRVQMIQASNPAKTEESINQLRLKYVLNPSFRKIWEKIVKFGSILMKWDAQFQPLRNIMNICVIYKKKS